MKWLILYGIIYIGLAGVFIWLFIKGLKPISTYRNKRMERIMSKHESSPSVGDYMPPDEDLKIDDVTLCGVDMAGSNYADATVIIIGKDNEPDYKKWGLKLNAQAGLYTVTHGSESPDYLFRVFREINGGEVSKNACLTIAYMGETIQDLKNRNSELIKENVKLKRKLDGEE